MTKRGGSDPKISCPACGSAVRVMRGYNVTPVYREVTYSCANHDCQLIFVASLTPVREISPSLLTDPLNLIPRHSAAPAPPPG